MKQFVLSIMRNIYKICFNVFKRLFRKIINDIYCVEFISSNETKLAIQRAFVNISINKISGDYYEFGLYKGQSFMFALEEARRAKLGSLDIHCIGFDSFEGLPDIDPVKDEFKDDLGVQKWNKNDYSCPFAYFNAILNSNGFSPELYTIYKGYFEETLSNELQKKLRKASVIHIDCDLYSSAKIVMDFIKPLLQQGTIVIFDDFYCFKGDPSRGEGGALCEFLSKNINYDFIPWYDHHSVGKSFIVNIKS